MSELAYAAHLVCFRDICKLVVGLFHRNALGSSFIRVEPSGKLSVCTLDVQVRGIIRHTKNIVVLLPLGHFLCLLRLSQDLAEIPQSLSRARICVLGKLGIRGTGIKVSIGRYRVTDSHIRSFEASRYCWADALNYIMICIKGIVAELPVRVADCCGTSVGQHQLL